MGILTDAFSVAAEKGKVMDDLISRQALLLSLPLFDESQNGFPLNGGIFYARAIITAAPTVNAEPIRRGKWVPEYIPVNGRGNSTHKLVYVCDQCERRELRPEHYCHCGAKMEGGDTDG